MQSKIHKLLTLKDFFLLKNLNNNIAIYTLKEPSKLILCNVYEKWLASLWQKTDKHYPIFLNTTLNDIIYKKYKIPVGYTNNILIDYNSNPVIEHDYCDFLPKTSSTLALNVILPQLEVMQYFLQWQRYRKYWWSTITTTPGLFSLSDIQSDDNKTEVNVLAQFPWGEQTVENISITKCDQYQKVNKTIGRLESVMTLEGALFTLLCDALISCTTEEYLRLNRTMAPYKLSFALDYNSDNVKGNLYELVNLLNHKVTSNKISTWLPDFSLSLQMQLKRSREMGIAYTAILNENTLTNGIFNILNSSTMLEEQVHVANFELYAKLLSSV